MSRIDRAKQFNPFDALKGLKEAIELVNFKHERIERGDILEDKVEEMCKTFQNITEKNLVEAKYYSNEHIIAIRGNCKVDFVNKFIVICDVKISFNDLFDIKIVE